MTVAAQLMAGKKGLVMGVANERSIAWGIAKACHDQGAEVAFTFQGEALEKRVRPLAASLGSDFLIDCDVSDMDALDTAFATLAARWPTIDFVVHAIGFSDKNELRGRYYDTSLDNFLMTMNISAYSLVAVTRRGLVYVAFDDQDRDELVARHARHLSPRILRSARGTDLDAASC